MKSERGSKTTNRKKALASQAGQFTAPARPAAHASPAVPTQAPAPAAKITPAAAPSPTQPASQPKIAGPVRTAAPEPTPVAKPATAQVSTAASAPKAEPTPAAQEKPRIIPSVGGNESKATATRSSGQYGNKTITIEAKIDVGFGNKLYLRGEGHGLSWNQGVPLINVDSSTWKWSGEADANLKFKLLLNDCVWSKGEDLVATPGQKVEVAPAF